LFEPPAQNSQCPQRPQQQEAEEQNEQPEQHDRQDQDGLQGNSPSDAQLVGGLALDGLDFAYQQKRTKDNGWT
jgi:hypothetical protein